MTFSANLPRLILGSSSPYRKELLSRLALPFEVIVPAIENALGASFLPRDIYLISRMPSDPQSADIWPIALISLGLSFVATVYPSWRASRIQPAEALRYE